MIINPGFALAVVVPALAMLFGAKVASAQAVSTVCTFTAAPRAGTSFDYAATWRPLAVGTPRLDGMGSTGFVR